MLQTSQMTKERQLVKNLTMKRLHWKNWKQLVWRTRQQKSSRITGLVIMKRVPLTVPSQSMVGSPACSLMLQNWLLRKQRIQHGNRLESPWSGVVISRPMIWQVGIASWPRTMQPTWQPIYPSPSKPSASSLSGQKERVMSSMEFRLQKSWQVEKHSHSFLSQQLPTRSILPPRRVMRMGSLTALSKSPFQQLLFSPLSTPYPSETSD